MRSRSATSSLTFQPTEAAPNAAQGPERLLFVVNNPAFFLSHRLNIARAARDSGFAVHVATPIGLGIESIRAEGFEHHVMHLSRWGMNIAKEVQVLTALWRLYSSLRPTIVHHVTIKPVLYGSIVARLTGVPAVVNAVSGLGNVFISSGYISAVRRFFIRSLYRLAFRHQNTRVIFQNHDDRSFFISEGIARATDVCLIHGSGVDEALFSPTSEPPGEVQVVMPSRLTIEKGVIEFVEAARLLRARGVRARFVLVGGEEPTNPVRVPRDVLQLWRKEGIVQLHGHQDNIYDVFRNSHVVCLPSYREGNPKALIEAAACARPIVTTDTPGCREIVKDGINGFLVPVKDSVALANALERLIMDSALRTSFGNQGRAIVLREGYTDRAVVEATLSLYRELLAKVATLEHYRFPTTRSCTASDGS